MFASGISSSSSSRFSLLSSPDAPIVSGSSDSYGIRYVAMPPRLPFAGVQGAFRARLLATRPALQLDVRSRQAADGRTPTASGGAHPHVNVVVVVAAHVGFPDALDPLIVVPEVEEPATVCLGARSGLRVAREEACSLHDPVANRAVVRPAVRVHPDVDRVPAEVVG